MGNNIKLHDRIIKYLILNNSQIVLFARIKKEEYFFIAETVDFNFYKFMKKRKKAMGNVKGYDDAVLNLGVYFQLRMDSIFLGEFIFENNSFYIFFDNQVEAIIATYNSSHVNMNKVIKLNKEYKLRNFELIKYEHYYPLNLDFLDV